MKQLWDKYWRWIAWILIVFSLGYGITGLIISQQKVQSISNSQDTPKSQESLSPTPTISVDKKISTDSIFGYKTSDNIDSKQPGRTSLLVTGDVLLARTVNAKMVSDKDFVYPFALTQKELRSGDITYINLETPLTPDCKVKTEGMVFCGSVEGTVGIVAAGVDVANFANNHAGNQGGEGIIDTISALRQVGIPVTGVGELVTIERDGKKFGFLGFNHVAPRFAGIAWADVEDVRAAILSARSQVDFVIVQFHWGEEYTTNANASQKLLAHAAVDAGADLVVGNHPHWVQGVEIYKDKFIAYSHGNFIFDQQWSKPTTEGVVGKYIFDDKKLVGVEYYPVIMDKTLQTRWADQKEAEPILKRMQEASK